MVCRLGECDCVARSGVRSVQTQLLHAHVPLPAPAAGVAGSLEPMHGTWHEVGGTSDEAGRRRGRAFSRCPKKPVS